MKKRVMKIGCAFLVMLLICLSGCEFMFGGASFSDNDFYYDESLMRPRMIDIAGSSNSIAVSKNVAPAVVGITSALGSAYSIGSGVAVKAGGYVLTNSHVITNKGNIKLYLANGNNTTATLVWRDEGLDLAIIKSKVDLPYLPLVNADGYNIGEDVIAIGTPLSLEFKHTVTKGIISALNRTLSVEGANGSTLQNLIQHDASINPGNSGGPLINMKGELVGINTLKVETAEGLGFAIPITVAAPVITEVSATGKFKSSYIGLFGYDASLSAFEGKNNAKYGVYVESVAEKSPLYLAGVKKGDVITAINGDKVKTMLDLRTKLFGLRVSDSVEVGYISNGFEKTVKITLQEKPVINL